MNTDRFDALAREFESKLHAIAGWWLEHVVDLKSGRIATQVSNRNRQDVNADLGLVYVSRLLWFFSAAYRFSRRAAYRQVADLCHHFLLSHFTDHEHGGLAWSVDSANRQKSRKKQSYGQAFAIYGLSEYAMATGEARPLEEAGRLVKLLERHALDEEHGGYLEALAADWGPLTDVRLGEKDRNADKTMNTHLHILEAYTNYYRAKPSPDFAGTLENLVTLFLERFVAPGGETLVQYYSRDWRLIEAARSYGHDIEASWLLWEAACLLGDKAIKHSVRGRSIALAEGVLEHGTDNLGGVVHEGMPGRVLDPARVWWVQAEALVGFFNAWQMTGRPEFLQASGASRDFIADYQRDSANGEWYWYSILDPGAGTRYKAGFWKAPYHNGRAMMEMARRMAEQHV